MRILLIKQKNNYPNPAPNFDIIGQGLPYIAGSLKKHGHEVFGINIITIIFILKESDFVR